MTFFSPPIRSLVGRLRPHVQAVDRSGELSLPIQSELWFAKVVSTLIVVRYHSIDSFSSYLSQRVTPLTAYEAVRRIENPNLALGFLEFSREKWNLNHSVKTYDHLLRMFCQLDLSESADSVLGYMRVDGFFPERQPLCFLAGSLVESGRYDNLRMLLAQVELHAVDAGVFVYNRYLNALVRRNRVQEAVGFFKEYMICGSHSCVDTCTFNILIRGLCRARELDEAFWFFYEMSKFGFRPDIVTYNTLIDGLCKCSEVARGHELLKELQRRDDISPDVKTFTAVLSGYCKMGRMDEAMTLFHEMTVAGIKPTLVTFNVLIDGFGKLGDMVSAAQAFEKMLFVGCSPDIVTFSSLIDGYCRAGRVDDGLKLWNHMIARNLSPNKYTFSIVINALCKQNRLLEARGFLVQLRQRNIVPQPFMYNPVIDGLCKAGNLEEANLVVAEMEEIRCQPDKLTFTILIIGHCMKGRMWDAIDIFNKMFAVKCSPDSITINCLVSCLLKAGMNPEAKKLMERVASDNVNPSSSSSNRSIASSTRMDVAVAV